jgi:uncharacterized protein YggE
MAITIKPGYRAPAAGIAAAALLIGSFLLGTAQSGAAGSGPGTGSGGTSALATLTSSVTGGKITVTGTGTVNGTPNQLVLSMGVQVNAASVSSALQQANRAASRVIASLVASGVTKVNISTSGLSIQPNYRGSGQVPIGYGVSEELTATLTTLSKAGSQIQAAVTAGGNATTVDGISVNLTDTSALLADARAKAVRDAQTKATQFVQAMGEHLGPVISISDQTSSGPYFENYGAEPAASGAARVPISPGTQQVSVQIVVVYWIG